MRGKNRSKNGGGQIIKIQFRQGRRRQKIKIRYLALALAVVGLGLALPEVAEAENCPSLRVVFARGSGGERWNDRNYLAFKDGIESKLQTVNLDYEMIDLDYPAVAIGMEHLNTTAGAWFGSGNAYEFGESVDTGVRRLVAMTRACPGTQYVLGGYSQGAMVVSKSLRNLNAEQIIYAATFGDPKIYLPEGGGLNPPACQDAQLSDYRMYVPDCHAYKGLLGAYQPYEPAGFLGKVGTWCNKRDLFCSSYFVPDDHTAYVADGLYEDASRVIFNKIADWFGLENHVSSPHDVAVLLDLTAPMASMWEQYMTRVASVTTATFNTGGRVAMYYYNGAGNAYQPKKVCDFETCDVTRVKSWLYQMQDYYVGPSQGSLMSAAFNTMSDLTWKKGSTKSLVVLTASNFGSPNRQGMSLDKVTALSKRIDPVNIYVATDTGAASAEALTGYAELASQTGGRVATTDAEFDEMTDYMMARFDSLPQVEEWWEEDMGARPQTPKTEVTGVEWRSETEVKVGFATDGSRVMVALNDAVLGVVPAEEAAVTLTGVDREVANTVTLVPLGEEVRGEAVEVVLNEGYGSDGSASESSENRGAATFETVLAPVPKAPATGRR